MFVFRSDTLFRKCGGRDFFIPHSDEQTLPTFVSYPPAVAPCLWFFFLLTHAKKRVLFSRILGLGGTIAIHPSSPSASLPPPDPSACQPMPCMDDAARQILQPDFPRTIWQIIWKNGRKYAEVFPDFSSLPAREYRVPKWITEYFSISKKPGLPTIISTIWKEFNQGNRNTIISGPVQCPKHVRTIGASRFLFPNLHCRTVQQPHAYIGTGVT